MTSRPAAHAAADLLPPPDRIDGLTSWAEVEELLGADWLALHDRRGRCLIRVRDGLGLVEHPGLLPTVRDVLGADVGDLAVTLLPETEPEDEWDEWDDVDCTCGPGRACPCGA